MRRFFAFMMIALCAVFSAHAATNTGAFPNDGKMLEDWTYTNAANETNVGTDGGNVSAAANYEWNEIALPAGKYLPADTDGLIANLLDCTSGNYCAGTGANTVHYNQSQPQGLTACPSGYGNSAVGSTDDTDCYRTCDINNMTTASNPNGTIANIAHATQLTGNDYYGNGNDTCEPATCVTGYHVQRGSLPNGYTELEYVNMNSGAYLLTDLVPTYNCKIEMDFQTTTVSGGAMTYVGGRTAAHPAGLRLGTDSANKWAVGSFRDSYVGVTGPSNNTRYKFVYNNQRISLTSNGTTIFNVMSTGTSATGAELAINALNNAGTIVSHQEGIYLYSFKMWDNQGTLVANYVPAQHGNTVGFYDTVSESFKGATSGTFVAGPDKYITYGTGSQSGTPTPTNPIEPVFYTNGNMVLRRVGDYADSYDATTGKITRRVGVKVLDGTESWTYEAGTTRFVVAISDFNSHGVRLTPMYCSHFINISDGRALANVPDNSFYSGSPTETPHNIYIKNTTYSTTTAWTTWLADQYAAGTPVIVVYPLAEAYEETWGAPQLLATCEPNTYNITWTDTLLADVTANGAGTATYGGNINTPVKINPADVPAGKRFIGWTFEQASQTPSVQDPS